MEDLSVHSSPPPIVPVDSAGSPIRSASPGLQTALFFTASVRGAAAGSPLPRAVLVSYVKAIRGLVPGVPASQAVPLAWRALAGCLAIWSCRCSHAPRILCAHPNPCTCRRRGRRGRDVGAQGGHASGLPEPDQHTRDGRPQGAAARTPPRPGVPRELWTPRALVCRNVRPIHPARHCLQSRPAQVWPGLGVLEVEGSSGLVALVPTR